tara:strand:+ start:4888 stop:5667 length:780 start_codon:yes stop_codon:yes gene_type:complete
MSTAVYKLKCPYDEKDEAKALGARWNSRGRYWYVEATVYEMYRPKFTRWAPKLVSETDARTDAGAAQPSFKKRKMAGDWTCPPPTSCVTVDFLPSPTDDRKTRGSIAEQWFWNLARSKGFHTQQATTKEDILKHWDILVWDSHIRAKVDVKSVKKVDGHFSFDKIWIELDLGRNDKHVSWLFTGEADWIAFQQENKKYLVVDRIKLATWTKERMQDAPFSSTQTLYTKYQRHGPEGRMETLMLVLRSDIPPDAIIHYLD